MGISAASEAEEAHNEEEIRILMEESYKYGYIDKASLPISITFLTFPNAVPAKSWCPARHDLPVP